MSNDPNDSKIEFPNPFNMLPKSFKVLWVVTALLGLGLTGVVVWAIIRLVMHFTS